jgi:hypothetical protein
MKSRSFSWRTFPFALLALLVLSFGLLIPWLGFYWDDWPAILVARLQGIRGYWAFYQVDRPFSAWTFMLTVPLLGVRPVAWQIFSLLLRWATTLGLWFSLRLLWPKRAQAAAWMAVLFAVYPAFDLQPVSVAFSQHWITYGLFFASIAAMLLSQRSTQRYALLLGVGLLAQVAHLMTMEYFVGLELLRPYLLWIVHSDPEGPSSGLERRQRLLLVLRRWLPYLLILGAYLVYRFVFSRLAFEDTSRLVLVQDLARQPLAAIKQLLGLALPDLLYTLFGAWAQTLDPARVDLSQPIGLFSAGMTILVAGLCAIYLIRLRLSDRDADDHWTRQAALLGALVLLLGPLPIWMIGKQAVGGMYNSRFALAALFGASVLVVAFLEWLKAGGAQKAILIAVLAGLATGQHLRTANDFRWSWSKQTQFYWQLHWRAPNLQPETMVLSDGEIFPYVGINSTAAGLNLLYPLPQGSGTLGYWFSDLYREFGSRNVAELASGLPAQRQLRSFWYDGSSQNSLVIYYQPGGGRCLWVLSPQDDDNPDLPKITVDALPAANLARIGSQDTPGYPPEAIFGPEPEHNWCYFYEKAELARQMGDWQAVAGLADEALAQGFSPNQAQEWLPFIEAYAYTGRWPEALERSLHVWRVDHGLSARVCQIWQRVEARPEIRVEQRAGLDDLKAKIGCQE